MAFPTRVSEVIKVVSLVILGLSFVSNIKAQQPLLGARRALADGDETVFDVTTYGAKPDGESDSSMKFIRAWNAACHSTGRARLVVPPGDFLTGEVVFQGPCTAHVTIELQGNILSSTDISLFSRNTWIMIENVDGVDITGDGTLNGNGQDAWKYNVKGSGEESVLPVSLMFEEAKNIVVQNIKLLNSKGFHLKAYDSDNILVTNVKITAPYNSPNTDGFHISKSRNITISSSTIATGDDCVSIGDGNTDINVIDVTCGPGHGISIGSLGKRQGETDVKGVTVRNCTLIGTTNGARIKSYHASPVLSASAIIFEDIVMDNVKNPIIIDQHYHSKASNEPSKVKISDVHFKNIRGTTTTPIAISLKCSETAPCEGIELADINFTGAPGLKGTISSDCINAKLVLADGAQIPPGCH